MTKENHGDFYKNDSKGRPMKKNYGSKFPDPTFMEVWSLYIRGLKLWYLYPLLLIFDFQNFASAVQNRLTDTDGRKEVNDPDDSDDIINQVLITLYNRHRYWTPWAWLAHKIHPEDIAIQNVKYYFADLNDPGDNLNFFVVMFRCVYASVRGKP